MIFPYINEVQYRLNHLDEGKVGIVTLDNEDVIAPDGTLGLLPMGGKWCTLLSLGALDHPVDVIPLPPTSRNLSPYFTDGLENGYPTEGFSPEFYDLLAGKGAQIAEGIYLASNKIAPFSWFDGIAAENEPAPAPVGGEHTISPVNVSGKESIGGITIDEPSEARMLYLIHDGVEMIPLFDFNDDDYVEGGAVQALLHAINDFNTSTQWFTNIVNYAAEHIDEIELDPEDTRTKKEIYDDDMQWLAEFFSSQVAVYDIYMRTQGLWTQIDKTKTYDIDLRESGIGTNIDTDLALEIITTIMDGRTCFANIAYIDNQTDAETFAYMATLQYTGTGQPYEGFPHTTFALVAAASDESGSVNRITLFDSTAM